MMHKVRQVSLFYHPTTTIFLDDDTNFLSYIQFKISKLLNCKYFNCVDKALASCHLPYNEPHTAFFDKAPSNTPIGDALFSSEKKLDESRFIEPTVIIVDYQMPDTNGLEICKQITNPYIKKILLTGVADEHVAVTALNEGIIDYYIHKAEPELSDKVVMAIKQLQQHYFSELFSRYPIYFYPPHIKDPSFADYFYSVREKYGIDEYYFMDNPMGILMINSLGESFILLAYTDDEFDDHIDHCHEYSAPETLVNQLIERQQVPFFLPDNYYFFDGAIENWQQHLFPVTRIEGEQTYYCSVISVPNVKVLPDRYQTLVSAFNPYNRKVISINY